jgi:hypothetical protein
VRLLYLYVHSRRGERALQLLGGVVVLIAVWHLARGGRGPSVGPLLVLPALAAAVIIPVGTGTPFGELEATMSRSLGPLRLTHMLSFIAAAAIGLAAASGSVDWGVMRNVAGLTGLGLLAARVAGPSVAWIAPLCFATYALAGNPRSAWTWPVHSGTAIQPALIAAVLVLAGLVAIVPHGAPMRSDTRE